MYPAIGNVKEGRLPEEAIEIALSEDALQYLGLDAVIGDTVSLDLSVSVMDGSLSELEYSACQSLKICGIKQILFWKQFFCGSLTDNPLNRTRCVADIAAFQNARQYKISRIF